MESRHRKLVPLLAGKVFIAVAAVVAVGGGMFVYVAHRTGYELLEEQAHAKAHSIAEMGKAILSRFMLEADHAGLRNALNSIKSTREAKAVLILRSDGTVYCSTDSSPGSSGFSLDEFSPASEWLGERYRTVEERSSMFEYVVTPIPKSPACFRCHPQAEPGRGFLAVKISVDDLRASARKHRTTNIAMTIGTFLGIGGVIFFSLIVLVIRPVARLRDEMHRAEQQLERLESGERVAVAPLHVPRRRDEIAELIVAFNRLMNRLNESHAALRDLHQGELQRADRLATVGEMAAGIAHEIKNPLAGVLGALQVMDADVPETDERKAIMKEMMLQLERMNHAINDLLSYARPSKPVFETTELREIVDRTLALLKPNGPVGVELPAGLPPLRADRKLLQQLLWNIILNAIQAMEPGGALTIRSAAEGSFVRIEVADTGKGIPPELQAKIFEPFFTTKHKGTGLGLAISRRIAEQHGGTLSIAGAEGVGTTVVIMLPAALPGS